MCMLSTEDLKQISGKGITEEQVKNQLEDFKKGFPFLKIDAAASVGNGVVAPADDMRKQYIEAWNNYKAEGRKIVKFVPASGAASRMFKDMFGFLNADYNEPLRRNSLHRSRNSPSTMNLTTPARPTTARALMLWWPKATTKPWWPTCSKARA